MQTTMSSRQEVKVYLFKAAAEEDPSASDAKDRFSALLNAANIDNQLVPVLVFEYSNLKDLWQHLQSPANHAGIVVTSPRCVQSIIEATKAYDNSNSERNWEVSLRRDWESKFIFCVGPSTATAARQLFPSVKTELLMTGLESHAESLANKIIEVNSKEALQGSLLYPCGVQRRDVLLNKLNLENISCSQCTVYSTIENPTLEAILRNLNYPKDKVVMLCFFSPSGVKYVFQYLDPNMIAKYQMRFIAIGPTTKTALEDCFAEKGVTSRVYQCVSPTPEALIDAVMSVN